MITYTDAYLVKCLEFGILTKEKIRKYPLRQANLAIVLKTYAVKTNQPYDLTSQRYDIIPEGYYLTEAGFLWLLDVYSEYSVEFLKRTFPFTFVTLKSKEHLDPSFSGYANFRGDRGDKPPTGTKQKAILVHRYKRAFKEYHFDTIKEARERLFELSSIYPVTDFLLYRVRKLNKNGKETFYKEKIPTFIEKSDRGKGLYK
jgi:hypothetical protein